MQTFGKQLQDAIAVFNQADYTRAAKQFEKLLKYNPDMPEAKHFLGLVYWRTGKAKKGLRMLEQAYKVTAQNPWFLSNYGLILQESGNQEKAGRLLQRAVQLKPDEARFWFNLAVYEEGCGRFKEARQAYNSAITLAPDYTRAIYNLATLSLQVGDLPQAIELYSRVCALDKQAFEARYNLAALYLQTGDLDSSLAQYQEAVILDPESVSAQLGLCNVLILLGEITAANELLSRLENAQESRHLICYYQGRIHQARGEYESAKAAYEQAIQLKPDYGPAYEALVSGIRLDSSDKPIIDTIHAALDNSKLQPEHKISCHYALGKAYDDLGEYDLAFESYKKANQLEAQQVVFDKAGLDQFCEQARDYFNADSVVPRRDPDVNHVTPVFIMGMPRSGTTLVEQMLAGHDKIKAGGELTYIPDFINKITGANAHSLVQSMQDMTAVDRAALDARYQSLIKTDAESSVQFVSDKLPTNFLYLGLIASILPQARFIYCLRNARDVCLSIYFQQFGYRHPYACNLEDIVHY
ncbi:MAG: tetratricopeptide repeat protein, partial [Gammaproteobacteria bacterium]